MNNGNEQNSCYDVSIIGFDSAAADTLVDALCRCIQGCTKEYAEHMLLHLPANIAHGVEAEVALVTTFVLEEAGAEVHVKHKSVALDRTLM
ncbi:MAG: hypothetical protein IKU34_05660 [Clostridia bacterium]|nr:hypothetical protein [Clostridia bacterium]